MITAGYACIDTKLGLKRDGSKAVCSVMGSGPGANLVCAERTPLKHRFAVIGPTVSPAPIPSSQRMAQLVSGAPFEWSILPSEPEIVKIYVSASYFIQRMDRVDSPKCRTMIRGCIKDGGTGEEGVAGVAPWTSGIRVWLWTVRRCQRGTNVRQAFDGASLESLSTGFVASPSRVHEGSGSGESFSFEALLITQSHHGVDEGSPSRRQVACDRCDYQQHNGCAHERDRVGGLESEQHVGD